MFSRVLKEISKDCSHTPRWLTKKAARTTSEREFFLKKEIGQIPDAADHNTLQLFVPRNNWLDQSNFSACQSSLQTTFSSFCPHTKLSLFTSTVLPAGTAPFFHLLSPSFPSSSQLHFLDPAIPLTPQSLVKVTNSSNSLFSDRCCSHISG